MQTTPIDAITQAFAQDCRTGTTAPSVTVLRHVLWRNFPDEPNSLFTAFFFIKRLKNIPQCSLILNNGTQFVQLCRIGGLWNPKFEIAAGSILSLEVADSSVPLLILA